MAFYTVFYVEDDEPIMITPANQEIGIHFPIFDNPLDALRFGELFSTRGKYYIKEVFVLHGARQYPNAR